MMLGQRRDITHGRANRQQGFQGHQRGTVALHGLLHLQRRNGIGRVNVRADQHDPIRLQNVLIAHRPSMGALDAPEGPHPVDVAVPRAAVDLIRPDHESHEFLKHVHVFIRTPGRHQPGNRIGPVGRFQRQQLPGNVTQGILPRDRGKGAVGLTNKRG